MATAPTNGPTRSGSRAPVLVTLLVGLVLGAGGIVLAGSFGMGPAAPGAAPSLADPSATATELTTDYFELLVAKDVTGLEGFLSPAFRLMRADGSTTGKAEYLADGLPTIATYALDGIAAAQSGDILVVTYTAEVSGTANGKAYARGPAPRISTFAWEDGGWRLAAHANFNPLTGTAATPGGTAYTLAFEGTSDPTDNRFTKVGTNGTVQYGTGRIAGSGTLGSTLVDAEILVALDYREGTGPFTGYLTLTYANGDRLGFSLVGSAVAEGDVSTIEGALTAIGGTGALEAVTGTGTLSGTRAGPVGSPVSYRLDLSLVGLPD